MNLFLTTLLAAVFFAGCATTDSTGFSKEDKAVRNAFNSVNSNAIGEFRINVSKDFSGFNEEQYLKIVNSGASDYQKDVKDLLPKFSIKEFTAAKTSVVFCAFSPNLGIAFCDDMSCEGVEKFEKSSSPDIIKTWQKELPLKSCAPDATATTTTPEPQEMGLLAASSSLEAADYMVLDHKYFVVHYDKSYRLARYVNYTLTADQLKKSKPGAREDDFRADPMLATFKSTSVTPKEYLHSGYDQGHLANSKDFSYSSEANSATFVMSNMAPQKPNLNRNAWLKLENQVRKWACGENQVTVITGPILKKDLKKLKSGLVIPEKFFKIVLDETPPKKSLAFIYTQADKGDMMAKRQVSVADLKAEILPQLEAKDRPDFTKYPEEPIANWKSIDCFTKKKSKPTKVVKK
jgi:DNA/RNA endonuclease G (NUC1)